MSYSFTIAGHSPNPHNDDVVKIAVKAVRDLKALEGSVSLTGYTYDSSGVNKALNDELVAEFEALDAKAAAAEEAPAEEAAETPAEETAEEKPAEETAPAEEPVSTESAPTTPAPGA